MKIPFDIAYRSFIESGEYKVETRDGRPARIICWDRKSEYGFSLIVLIECESSENPDVFSVTGKYRTDRDSDEDLFIITPEPELTEFEEKVKQLIGHYPVATKENKGSLIYEVRKEAIELLKLAKKEICKDCTVGLDQYWKGREDARKEYEKPITFHYPIYQPPCFYGGVCTNPMKDCINCPRQSSGATINTSETNKAE